ncbi:MAG TPA: glycosyltransferase family 4 protein [Chthoniobacterales bacterium]
MTSSQDREIGDARLPHVAQISIGRFHHFHLARQLERHGMLEAIFTGYPRFKLRDETGIPWEKIHPFPWLQAPYMMRGRFHLDGPRISREWEWWAKVTLDAYASVRLGKANRLVALSGMGLISGRKIQLRGGTYVCDRGSSHIRYQHEILRDEYLRWGFEFPGVDPRVILREEAEYETADRITVPSEFVRRSFLQKGVPEAKVVKIPYGARLDRFRPVADPDPTKFTVLFVGQVSLRKGFMDLLMAFEGLRHPTKELLVIGGMSEEVRQLLRDRSVDNVHFLGNVPNAELPQYYSRADVFALPSIEEGLSMVMGEALACGCPIVATSHTGAEDLFTDGKEGFIVDIRTPKLLLEKLEHLAQDCSLRRRMGEAALVRVRSIGGWDQYGADFGAFLGCIGAPKPQG